MEGCSTKFGNEPKDIQIFALLYFLLKDMDKRLIEKIYAAKGKTIIISFLSIIKALK